MANSKGNGASQPLADTGKVRELKLSKTYDSINNAYKSHVGATRNDWHKVVTAFASVSPPTADGQPAISQDVYRDELVRFTLSACLTFGHPVQLTTNSKGALKIEVPKGSTVDPAMLEQDKGDARRRFINGVTRAAGAAKIAMPAKQNRGNATTSEPASTATAADVTIPGIDVKLIDVSSKVRELSDRFAHYQNAHAAKFDAAMREDHGKIGAIVAYLLHAFCDIDGQHAPAAPAPDATQSDAPAPAQS